MAGSASSLSTTLVFPLLHTCLLLTSRCCFDMIHMLSHSLTWSCTYCSPGPILYCILPSPELYSTACLATVLYGPVLLLPVLYSRRGQTISLFMSHALQCRINVHFGSAKLNTSFFKAPSNVLLTRDCSYISISDLGSYHPPAPSTLLPPYFFHKLLPTN